MRTKACIRLLVTHCNLLLEKFNAYENLKVLKIRFEYNIYAFLNAIENYNDQRNFYFMLKIYLEIYSTITDANDTCDRQLRSELKRLFIKIKKPNIDLPLPMSTACEDAVKAIKHEYKVLSRIDSIYRERLKLEKNLSSSTKSQTIPASGCGFFPSQVRVIKLKMEENLEIIELLTSINATINELHAQLLQPLSTAMAFVEELDELVARRNSALALRAL